MAQYDFGTIDPYVDDGVQLADMLNKWRDAMYSMQRGPARPAFIVPGQLWVNDSAGPENWVINYFISPVIGDVPLYFVDTVTGQVTSATMVSTEGGIITPFVRALPIGNLGLFSDAGTRIIFGPDGKPRINYNGDYLYPDTDGDVSIGGGENRWKNIWSQKGNFSQDLDFKGGISREALMINYNDRMLFLRNIGGTNRIDSYDSGITMNVPFLLNGGRLAFAVADQEKFSIEPDGTVHSVTPSPAAVGTEVATAKFVVDAIAAIPAPPASGGIGGHVFFSAAGAHTFTPTKTGKHKITAVGGGGVAGVASPGYEAGGGAGGKGIKWVDLVAGVDLPMTVGGGAQATSVSGMTCNPGGAAGGGVPGGGGSVVGADVAFPGRSGFGAPLGYGGYSTEYPYGEGGYYPSGAPGAAGMVLIEW